MCDCFVFKIYVVALFLILSYLFYLSVLRVLVVLVSSVCLSPPRCVVSLVSVLFPCLVGQIMSSCARDDCVFGALSHFFITSYLSFSLPSVSQYQLFSEN